MVRFGADAGLPVPPGPGPMAVSCRLACPATATSLRRAGLVRGLPGRCAPYARAPDPPCADASALREVSARGFAWREDLERLVSRDRPAKIPAPGRCPSWPWPPGPGQSRALRAWCPTPGDGGPSGQRPARETRPRAAPVAACAVRGLCRCCACSAAPANPAGSPAPLGADGQRVSCGCRQSIQCARLRRSQGL